MTNSLVILFTKCIFTGFKSSILIRPTLKVTKLVKLVLRGATIEALLSKLLHLALVFEDPFILRMVIICRPLANKSMTMAGMMLIREAVMRLQ